MDTHHTCRCEAVPPCGINIQPGAADTHGVLRKLTLSQLADFLEDELRSRVDAIRAALPEAATTVDSDRFLRTLRSATTTSLRPAPAAAQRALARTRNPDIGLAQLVEVVEDDPTLGQALLRYANSAYYAGGGIVVSLRQAAQRVGAAGVHNVVLGVMLDGMLCRPGSAYESMLNAVRTHVIRTAPIARCIARAFGVPPDEAYALSLLHDAGKLIVFDVIGTMRHELRREVKLAPTLVGRALRELHEPLGGLAALRWGLGTEAAVPIATHHRNPVYDADDRMSELVYVAERAELALSGAGPSDLAAWWEAGSITTDRARVQELLAAYSPSDLAA